MSLICSQLWLSKNLLWLQGEGYISGAENDEDEPLVKKKRYAEGRTLDQTDCKFGIKVENDEVLLMSDESELSSLNDTEFEQVKKVFDRVSSFLTCLNDVKSEMKLKGKLV